MYEIYPVPDDAAEAPEQLGTKPKFWFTDSTSARRLLFKEARGGTGEDWAEKVAAELCALLGLPHGSYDLATWRQRRGVVTQMFVPDGGRLILGNELLGRFVPGYEGEKTYEQRQHTVRVVMTVLRDPGIALPGSMREGEVIERAADAFCGYLLLDALIGNTDRHHENWGLIRQSDGRIELAPTFDHASSLGRNESDDRRAERLVTMDQPRSVAAYAARARSALYRAPTDGKPMLTTDAFYEAARRRPRAARYWLQKVSGLDCDAVCQILQQVPMDTMSDTAKRFAFEILKANKARILDRQGALT
jgi:hypothetical protein